MSAFTTVQSLTVCSVFVDYFKADIIIVGNKPQLVADGKTSVK